MEPLPDMQQVVCLAGGAMAADGATEEDGVTAAGALEAGARAAGARSAAAVGAASAVSRIKSLHIGATFQPIVLHYLHFYIISNLW